MEEFREWCLEDVPGFQVETTFEEDTCYVEHAGMTREHTSTYTYTGDEFHARMLRFTFNEEIHADIEDVTNLKKHGDTLSIKTEDGEEFQFWGDRDGAF